MHVIKTRTMRVRSTAQSEFCKACIALNETISKGHNRVEVIEVAQSYVEQFLHSRNRLLIYDNCFVITTTFLSSNNRYSIYNFDKNLDTVIGVTCKK